MFWEEISGHYDFIVERRMDYLNWRYCDQRGGSYIVKQAENNGRVVGYIVLRIDRYRDDYPVGTIVDLVTLPSRLDVAHILVADAINFFDEQEINSCRYLVAKNHPYEGILKRYGFLDGRSKVHLFYVSLGEEEELEKLSTSQAARIHFTYGDTDWI